MNTSKLFRIVSGVFAALLALAASLGTSAAFADDGDNEVGACLADDQVWLLAVTDTAEVLANQCVGTPTNGVEALENAGIDIGFDDGGMICTLGGHPEECPATFDGSYWSYYHGSPGEEYDYYEVGADSSEPKGGTIEAWCYATAETDSECTPPQLVITQDGEQVAPPEGTTAEDLAVTSTGADSGETAETTQADEADADEGQDADSRNTSVWIAVGALVIVIGLGLYRRQRIRSRSKDTLGGR